MNSLKSILVIAALWALLSVFAHAGSLTYIYTDPLGTPLAEADTSGNITATFDYRPYGSLALGAAPNGPGYTGHVNDPDTGLVYMQARFYDPDTGRFLSIDPVNVSAGNVLTFNRYVYADNNPINKSDPTGMCPDKNPCFEATPFNWYTDTFDGRFFGHLIGDTVAVLSKDNYNPLTNQFLDRGQIQEAKISMLTLAIPVLRLEEAALQGAASAIRWGPATGAGPLGEGIAATFRGGSYTQMVTQEEIVLFRAYGGKAGELGSYWTRTPPAGPLQARIDSALLPKWGNTAQSVSTIRVPAGTTIYEGFAAPQGSLMGGGSQVYIPKVDPAWAVK